uniref:Ribosomal protein L36 n=1 Tax=Laguncularia racemosa TaxID=190524 RepID=A0A859AT67_9MYRT|nr:ribosomal protein L36 [Laguncularia racemosa]
MDPFFHWVHYVRESFLKRLSLSLFMPRVGTNYYNSSPPTDQSTFFTNFTNGGPYFHSCCSLT